MVASVTERVCMDICPRSGTHMDDMRASRLFEMGLISVRYKLMEVLQLSRHVSRRHYISLLLPLITKPCAP